MTKMGNWAIKLELRLYKFASKQHSVCCTDMGRVFDKNCKICEEGKNSNFLKFPNFSFFSAKIIKKLANLKNFRYSLEVLSF
jgi:hypothetical protein